MFYKFSDGKAVVSDANGFDFAIFPFSAIENGKSTLFCGDKKTVTSAKYTDFSESENSRILVLFSPTEKDGEIVEERTAFVKKDGKIYCYSEREKTISAIVENPPENCSLTAQNSIISVLRGLLATDCVQIEETEKRLAETECFLMRRQRVDCTETIIAYRKKITALKRYYERFSRAVSKIAETDLPAPVKAEYQKLLSDLETTVEDVQGLRDFVSQVREAYQAQVDISLNSVMKFLTVVTSIFMPLTLIAGWYGMNVKMPEVEMENGYLIPICLTVFCAVTSVIYFLKKKWF